MSRTQLTGAVGAVCLVLVSVIAGSVEWRYAGIALLFGVAILIFLLPSPPPVQDAHLMAVDAAKKSEWLGGVLTRIGGELHMAELKIENAAATRYMWNSQGPGLSGECFRNERDSLSQEPALKPAYLDLIRAHFEIERLNELVSQNVSLTPDVRDDLHKLDQALEAIRSARTSLAAADAQLEQTGRRTTVRVI